MPDISVGSQIFDLVFHPTHSTVYAGLLTGHVKAFAFDEQGNSKCTFSLRPSKRSCRGLAISEDGSHLYAAGKSKALNIIDTVTEDIEVRAGAHESPINRIKCLNTHLLCTGDDDGVIKLWDPRQRECLRTYTQHFDYITDFLWLEDQKQLVATSGDGTLSVMDVRSKKSSPIAQSEDQEDELLSIVAIRGATKIVVGTQIGVLSIFNRSSGWADCVDRVPGHPHSIDALCALPALPDVDHTRTILTGSSDGYVRAVQLFPTKLLGVVADHGDWPVERIAIGGGTSTLTLEDGSPSESEADSKTSSDRGEIDLEEDRKPTRWWIGSVGHEDVLKLTDLEAFFRNLNSDEERSGHKRESGLNVSTDVDSGGNDAAFEASDMPEHVAQAEESDESSNAESDKEAVAAVSKKRKKKPEKRPLDVKKQKGKNSVDVDASFFDDL